MKSLTGIKGGIVRAFATTIAFLILPAASLAADFVLTAPKWGKKQEAAVAAAGGSVIWSHDGVGIAAVSSDNPDFLALVSANSAFTGAAEDMMVQWQDPDALTREYAVDPSDEPLFGLQWNMEAMEAPDAWAAGCTGAGVRVAINDGGINPTHPDLAPNMDTACSTSFVPGQPFDTDTGTFWHGMHVAGIVAAADNDEGVIGVAPEAELISVKVLHSGSGLFSWVIGGILYAADPAAFGRPHCGQADIINMSLGAVFNKRLPGGGPLVAAMNKAVNYATSKGTLVISAAGNDGLDLGQGADLVSVPAESGSGLAISSTGPVDWIGWFGSDGPAAGVRTPATYSNYGEGTIWVAAPGGMPGIGATVMVHSPASIAGLKFASEAAYGPLPGGERADVALWTDPVDGSGDPHDACDGGVDPNVAGKIALIHRGACTFVTKSAAAEASGALGVIISNNRAGAMPILGGAAPINIPSVGLTQSDGGEMEGVLPGVVDAELGYNPFGIYDQVVSTCASSFGYCLAYGTSMAAPAAAGVAALIKANNPGMSVAALKTQLAQTADDEGKIGHDEFYGHGFVNAYKACTR